MDNELIFSITSRIAMAGWLALLFAPLRRRLLVLSARGIALILCAIYPVLIAANWGSASGGYGSLAGVTALFSTSGLLLAGWVHYLAFDLWIGAWEADKAPEARVPHWLLVPCLLLTFLFGPAGLLLFLAIRTTRLTGARS